MAEPGGLDLDTAGWPRLAALVDADRSDDVRAAGIAWLWIVDAIEAHATVLEDGHRELTPRWRSPAGQDYLARLADAVRALRDTAAVARHNHRVMDAAADELGRAQREIAALAGAPLSEADREQAARAIVGRLDSGYEQAIADFREVPRPPATNVQAGLSRGARAHPAGPVAAVGSGVAAVAGTAPLPALTSPEGHSLVPPPVSPTGRIPADPGGAGPILGGTEPPTRPPGAPRPPGSEGPAEGPGGGRDSGGPGGGAGPGRGPALPLGVVPPVPPGTATGPGVVPAMPPGTAARFGAVPAVPPGIATRPGVVPAVPPAAGPATRPGTAASARSVLAPSGVVAPSPLRPGPSGGPGSLSGPGVGESGAGRVAPRSNVPGVGPPGLPGAGARPDAVTPSPRPEESRAGARGAGRMQPASTSASDDRHQGTTPPDGSGQPGRIGATTHYVDAHGNRITIRRSARPPREPDDR